MRVALTLLLLPLVATACGGSKRTTASASPLATVKSAAQKTLAAGTAHLTLSAQVVSGGQTVSVAGKGAFDAKAHDGSLDADFNAGAVSGSVQEVQKGTAVYLKSDLFALALPAGKTWIKLDLAKAAKGSGVDLRTLLAQDPSKALQELQSLKDATKVGSETVGGVSTTHYRAQSARGSYDMWIGDDGYLHRVRAVVSASGGKATVTTDLSSYGSGVSVTVPPAKQIYDATNTSIPGLGG
jgi:uncharacterized protein DUF2092